MRPSGLRFVKIRPRKIVTSAEKEELLTKRYGPAFRISDHTLDKLVSIPITNRSGLVTGFKRVNIGRAWELSVKDTINGISALLRTQNQLSRTNLIQLANAIARMLNEKQTRLEKLHKNDMKTLINAIKLLRISADPKDVGIVNKFYTNTIIKNELPKFKTFLLDNIPPQLSHSKPIFKYVPNTDNVTAVGLRHLEEMTDKEWFQPDKRVILPRGFEATIGGDIRQLPEQTITQRFREIADEAEIQLARIEERKRAERELIEKEQELTPEERERIEEIEKIIK